MALLPLVEALPSLAYLHLFTRQEALHPWVLIAKEITVEL